MKVYLQPPQPSLGLDRIATALTRYAPQSIEVTTAAQAADLTIIYAIGRRQRIERQTGDILSRGKRYAIIQVCLRSTMSPDTDDWYHIWKGATCVWSYYDLLKAIRDDGGQWMIQNFMHAPLGVDNRVFYDVHHPYTIQREHVIATSGVSRLQESVRECELAAQVVGRSMFHLGRKVTGKPHVTCAEGISDEELAQTYSTCEFVSGLRRTEGFELPAAEGLLCGARPVLFDTLDYRFNYRDWAEYVHEGTRQEVVDQLVQLFKRGAHPVTVEERAEAADWFNWERVCGEFWARCLQ